LKDIDEERERGCGRGERETAAAVSVREMNLLFVLSFSPNE
jgi:hypothetical protein